MNKQELEAKFAALQTEGQALAQTLNETQVKLAQVQGKMQLLQELYQVGEEEATPDATEN